MRIIVRDHDENLWTKEVKDEDLVFENGHCKIKTETGYVLCHNPYVEFLMNDPERHGWVQL